jgi:hypothetical protein
MFGMSVLTSMSHFKGRTQIEGIGQQTSKKNVWIPREIK